MRNRVFLKLGSLNIQGNARVKCETEEIKKLITKHHIYVIEESWLNKNDSCPLVSGYTPFRSERKKHPKAKRNSGGVIVFIKHVIAKGVTKIACRADRGGDAVQCLNITTSN